jgi:type VI secretion system protein ImpA
MPVDFHLLRQPVTPERPCGSDLSGSVAYAELDAATRGKPEIQYGTFRNPAEEPDWAFVEKQSVALLAQSKDLRILTYLTMALLCRQGYPGLRDGLALLRHTVDEYWDGLYPSLDPDDDNDPTERRNIIEALSPPEETVGRSPQMKGLLDAPLCESRRLGRIGLRQILWASGENAPPEAGANQPPDNAMLQAAFDEADLVALEALAQVIATAQEHLSALTDRLHLLIPDSPPSFSTLSRWLGRAAKELNAVLQRRGALPAGGAAVAALEPAASPDASPARTASGWTGANGIRNHDDVRKALDQICAWHAKMEPSSPVPLLLKRARRLVGLSFADIIRDLSPEALHQIEVIGGPLDANG